MELAVALSILASVISVSNFVLSRKDKAIKDAKEDHQGLIEYQLKELKEDVKAILSKLDRFEKDIDERIQEKMDIHIKMYHGGK